MDHGYQLVDALLFRRWWRQRLAPDRH
jgi:hypothetical protein